MRRGERDIFGVNKNSFFLAVVMAKMTNGPTQGKEEREEKGGRTGLLGLPRCMFICKNDYLGTLLASILVTMFINGKIFNAFLSDISPFWQPFLDHLSSTYLLPFFLPPSLPPSSSNQGKSSLRLQKKVFFLSLSFCARKKSRKRFLGEETLREREREGERWERIAVSVTVGRKKKKKRKYDNFSSPPPPPPISNLRSGRCPTTPCSSHTSTTSPRDDGKSAERKHAKHFCDFPWPKPHFLRFFPKSFFGDGSRGMEMEKHSFMKELCKLAKKKSFLYL